MTPEAPFPPDSLATRLFREGYRFDFFQAVRVLRDLRPGRGEPGGDSPPGTEAVRFTVNPALAYPPSAVHRVEWVSERDPPRMAVNFFGLNGPAGVLPAYFTEQVIALRRAGDNPERDALAAWLDLFSHRMLSLFYRAWAKYRLPVAYERAARDGAGPDPITRTLLSLIGLGTGGTTGRFRAPVGPGGRADRPEERIEDLALVRYAGLLANRARPAVGLEQLLTDYFGVPARVEPFRGRWLVLDPENRTRLGSRSGANRELGVSLVVGRRVWDVQGSFRVRLGPFDYPTFLEWLPDRGGAGERGKARIFLLAKLVRFYVRGSLDFDVQLVLRASEVPKLRLSRRRSPDRPRVGWNTWVVRSKPAADVGNAVFPRRRLVIAGAGPEDAEESGFVFGADGTAPPG
ncbi:MAG TPA: type VI secretion system baseplate subunit TssG [Gemmataceae bacterium]